jgi:anti-sigma regulatory factor (Ser/Thr protein kinase)
MSQEPRNPLPPERTEYAPEGVSLPLYLRVPAGLEWLSLLCAAVREYCAALPNVNTTSELATRFRRYATGALKIPGSSSYSNFVFALELILQEVTSNVVRHGYRVPGELEVKLFAAEMPDRSGLKRRAVVLEITDNGAPFDPTAIRVESPDPQELAESGYGLYLIQRFSDELEYSRQNNRNFLRVVKFIS